MNMNELVMYMQDLLESECNWSWKNGGGLSSKVVQELSIGIK